MPKYRRQQYRANPYSAALSAVKLYSKYRMYRPSYPTRSRGRRSSNRGYPTRGRRYRQTHTLDDIAGHSLNRLGTQQPRISRAGLNRIMSSERAIIKNVQMSGSGLSPYHYCKQVFAEAVNLGDNSAAPFNETMLLNSTFEPQEGDSSHQPLGRDILAGIYNDYTVLKCKWTIFFRNISSTVQSRVWVHADTAATSLVTTYQEAMERPDVQVLHLCATSENNVNESASLSGFVNSKNYMVGTAGSFTDQFTAGVGANPTIPIRLHIQAETVAGNAIPSDAIVADIQLQYWVVYKNVSGVTES